MFDPHRYPTNIITNHLVITALAVWHHEDFVWLLGFYGDATGEDNLNQIEIECTFHELNALLTELSRGKGMYQDCAQRAEEVIEQVAEALSHPVGEELDLLNVLTEDTEPLYFYEHVFSLALIHEEEEGQLVVPEDPAYKLRGFVRRATGWPRWEEGYRGTKDEEAATLARLLVLRYGLFLAFNGQVRRSEALIIAGLTDPQLFALAKVQYELMEEMVRREPEEWE